MLEFAFLADIANNFASASECLGLSMHPTLLALEDELEAADVPRPSKYRHVQHSRVIYHADRWTLYSAPAPHIDMKPNDDSNARVRRLSIADQGSDGPPAPPRGGPPHVGSSPGTGAMVAASGTSSSRSSGAANAPSRASSSSLPSTAAAAATAIVPAPGAAPAAVVARPSPLEQVSIQCAGIQDMIAKYMMQFILGLLGQGDDVFFSVPLRKDVFLFVLFIVRSSLLIRFTN